MQRLPRAHLRRAPLDRTLLLCTLLTAACAGTHPRSASTPAAGPTAAAAVTSPYPELVRLRLGDGPMSAPMPNPALGRATLHLSFPAAFAGRRVALAVLRDTADGRIEWLRLTPRVPQDGVLQVAGMEPGSYALRAELPEGGCIATGAVAVDGKGAIAATLVPAVASPEGTRR